MTTNQEEEKEKAVFAAQHMSVGDQNIRQNIMVPAEEEKKSAEVEDPASSLARMVEEAAKELCTQGKASGSRMNPFFERSPGRFRASTVSSVPPIHPLKTGIRIPSVVRKPVLRQIVPSQPIEERSVQIIPKPRGRRPRRSARKHSPAHETPLENKSSRLRRRSIQARAE